MGTRDHEASSAYSAHRHHQWHMSFWNIHEVCRGEKHGIKSGWVGAYSRSMIYIHSQSLTNEPGSAFWMIYFLLSLIYI